MTFGIRGNITRTGLSVIVQKLVREFEHNKINFLLERELSFILPAQFNKKLKGRIVTDQTLAAKSDFLISIGGDGTFLSTAKLVGRRNIPVIGVNLGKLGFLAEISTSKITKFVSDILQEKYEIEERTVLCSERTDAPSEKIFGMNEIVISQKGIVRTILIDVFYNKQPVISYYGDGIIVSTPTGSTGYSLSCGGPIVSPHSSVIIIVPICPHTLTARPMILPDSGSISVRINAKVNVMVTSDGNNSFDVVSPSSISIEKADYNIKIVKSRSSNYFKILDKKLYWGADKRNSKW